MLTLWLFVFTSCCICSQAEHIPPSFPKCALEGPDFSECFTKAIHDTIGQLTKPFSRVGLQTLDPLEIQSMILMPRDEKVLTVDVHFTNAKVYGYSKLRVQKAELSKDKKQLVIEGLLPELKQTSHYHINGTILQLLLHGEGESEINLYNTSLVNTFTLEEYEKEGHKFWKVTKTDLTLLCESGLYKLENLVNDHTSSDMINKKLNDHFKVLFDAGVKFYAPRLAEAHHLVANSFFSKVPISNIFA